MHSRTCNSWQYYDYVTAHPSVLAKGCDNVLARVEVTLARPPHASPRGTRGLSPAVLAPLPARPCKAHGSPEDRLETRHRALSSCIWASRELSHSCLPSHAQVGTRTVLVPFDGSTGLSAASFPGATTIDINIQQPQCGTVSLASFGYIITSSTVSLPNADLGYVSSLPHPVLRAGQHRAQRRADITPEPSQRPVLHPS